MFQEFPKMARLTRDCVITEKIDGTNAQVHIQSDSEIVYDLHLHGAATIARDAERGLTMFAGSRTRYITPTDDNFGFAKWVAANADALWSLGEGRHYGEWWGQGIQRGYGLTEKRFSLFNTGRWVDSHVAPNVPPDQISDKACFAPACCHVVPVLYRGVFSTEVVGTQIERLRTLGSSASPGFMKPEGVVVYHTAAGEMFKKTLDKDDEWKGKSARKEATA